MLQGWVHADVISAIALLVSCAAAAFTWQQMRIARRKERGEQEALKPVVEGRVGKERVAGWWDYDLSMRNRLDCSIFVENIKILNPSGLKLAPASAVVGVGPNYETTYSAPAGDAFSDRRNLGVELSMAGAEMRLGSTVRKQDRRHVELFLFRPSKKLSRDANTLEVSLRVRRSNERDSYAEIIVVTKMPPVTTNNVT